MKRRRYWPCHLWMLLLCFHFLCSSDLSFGIQMNENPKADDSLDSAIRYYALKALVHRRTGIVYDVPLPANLSGIRAAVVRLRSSTLWLNGVSIGSFRVPPRTIAVPPVPRLIIVYEDLGNWSASYYEVQNYSLATPVLGLLAYNASGKNLTSPNKLDFTLRGDPIVVSFSDVDLPRGMKPALAKCVTFGPTGLQRMDSVMAMNECSAENEGHFSIIVPKMEVVLAPSPVPEPAMEKRREKRREWVAWVIAFGSAVVGFVIVLSGGVAIAKFLKKTRMRKMARRAEEGEVLDTVWVSGSKMPSASLVRTQPVLENGSAS